MIYDLDELAWTAEDRDFFAVWGRPFAIGPVTARDRKEIAAIDPDNATEWWRAVIARMLSESNDAVPEVTDALVAALVPVIAKRIHE